MRTKGTKINTEVNGRVLKNVGVYVNIRHHWFQLVPISSSLAFKLAHRAAAPVESDICVIALLKLRFVGVG